MGLTTVLSAVGGRQRQALTDSGVGSGLDSALERILLAVVDMVGSVWVALKRASLVLHR